MNSSQRDVGVIVALDKIDWEVESDVIQSAIEHNDYNTYIKAIQEKTGNTNYQDEDGFNKLVQEHIEKTAIFASEVIKRFSTELTDQEKKEQH